jgi:hypothetical protein
MENETSDRLTALAALYQGEKTDAPYAFNTAMAMTALSVAYLIGAIPFVQSLSRGPSGCSLCLSSGSRFGSWSRSTPS